jgi:hypothetical protein
VGEERMAFEGFHDRHHAVMSTNSQVISLRHVVGKDYSRALADTRENCQENSSFQGLRFINNDK